MNILFACEYFFANPDFVRLSKELAKRNHAMSVVTSFRTVDKKAEEDIKIFEIKPIVTISKIPHTLSFPLSKVRQIVMEQNIDIVHTINDYSTNGAIAALVAKVANKPLVYTLQGSETRTGHLVVDLLSWTYGMTAGRLLAREARRVIVLSKSLTSWAERLRIESGRIVAIPSGIDSEHFSPERPDIKEKASRLKDKLGISDEIIVGYVGRLYPVKGLTYLFSAVEKIQGNHPNIILLIVGDGAQRNELEAIARGLKVRTIFAGWQRDVRPYHALMDIFVLPSLTEGLPNVILEAMAMKKAVVATKVGGNPDILSDGVNGFLVPVRNIQQLASALEQLIEDDNLRLKMGTMNRQKAEEQFLWSKTADKVEKVYNALFDTQH